MGLHLEYSVHRCKIIKRMITFISSQHCEYARKMYKFLIHLNLLILVVSTNENILQIIRGFFDVYVEKRKNDSLFAWLYSIRYKNVQWVFFCSNVGSKKKVQGDCYEEKVWFLRLLIMLRNKHVR